MPLYPGEERLVTLFTDCHYYFAQPTTRPVLHRFDKASYFYIYWNSTRHTSRIEVANNPGTPDQDAFYGFLDTCRVVNSHKFPTLVTLVIDASDHAPSPTSKSARDPEEWQLSNSDPRDANHMRYRLHTIDFYFWKAEDAKLVTGFFKKLLSPAQLDVVESEQSQLQPPPQQQQHYNQHHSDSAVSPVVQNLENVAISDPAYSNGQTRNSQNQPQTQAQVKDMHIPPPPPPPVAPIQSHTRQQQAASPSAASLSPVSQSSFVTGGVSPQSEKPAAQFTPLAYNPAAPAAPEKIAHREKTPPPEDGEHGTGLTAASMHDYPSTSGYNHSQSWGAPPTTSQTSQSGHWGSPPQASTTSPFGVPPPPPPVTSTYGSPPPPSAISGYSSHVPSSTAYTSSPPPQSQNQHQNQQSRTSASSAIPSFAPPPPNPPTQHTDDSHRHSLAAELYTPDTYSTPVPPVETPGTQFLNTVQPSHKPLQHIQPRYADYLSSGSQAVQPPPGGWSQYSYNQNPAQNPSGPPDSYEVHNQVYRPTEAEANKRHGSRPSRTDTAIAQNKTASKAKGFLKKLKAEADKL